jgi:hypothetical protein
VRLKLLAVVSGGRPRGQGPVGRTADRGAPRKRRLIAAAWKRFLTPFLLFGEKQFLQGEHDAEAQEEIQRDQTNLSELMFQLTYKG